jgi:hypothetical protein
LSAKKVADLDIDAIKMTFVMHSLGRARGSLARYSDVLGYVAGLKECDELLAELLVRLRACRRELEETRRRRALENLHRSAAASLSTVVRQMRSNRLKGQTGHGHEKRKKAARRNFRVLHAPGPGSPARRGDEGVGGDVGPPDAS